MNTFADYMATERARIHQEREMIIGQQSMLEGQLATLNREMAAIDAYEAAKEGRLQTAPAARRQGASRRGIKRAGSKREQIVQLVSNSPAGLSRGQLIDMIGVKGDKSGEMSISNALTALTKANTLARADGKYVLAQAA